MQPRLITVAPNGARKLPVDHPRLPITPDDIARESRLAADAGASLLHLHVRNPDGSHSLDPAHYRQAIAAVREACGDRLMIQITTESAGVFGWREQVRAVTGTRPEAASVALRELCSTDSATDRSAYTGFIADCLSEGVWLQHILYDVPDVQRFNRFHSDGVYGETPFVLMVVGRYSGAEGSTTDALDAMRHALAPGVAWAVCAFGAAETGILEHALKRGGHVRVGFENNLLNADGTIASSNAERVSHVARVMSDQGFYPMTREQIADAFALPEKL